MELAQWLEVWITEPLYIAFSVSLEDRSCCLGKCNVTRYRSVQASFLLSCSLGEIVFLALELFGMCSVLTLQSVQKNCSSVIEGVFFAVHGSIRGVFVALFSYHTFCTPYKVQR